MAHQNGTIRFGRDPRTSALDVNCRAHEVDNLYVVDGSFFPSSAAVNPALTIMANALRVGDHLKARLGWSRTPRRVASARIARTLDDSPPEHLRRLPGCDTAPRRFSCTITC